jgi:hypothetical protein
MQSRSMQHHRRKRRTPRQEREGAYGNVETVREWFHHDHADVDELPREEQEELFDSYLRDLHEEGLITGRSRRRWSLDGFFARSDAWTIPLGILIAAAVAAYQKR